MHTKSCSSFISQIPGLFYQPGSTLHGKGHVTDFWDLQPPMTATLERSSVWFLLKPVWSSQWDICQTGEESIPYLVSPRTAVCVQHRVKMRNQSAQVQGQSWIFTAHFNVHGWKLGNGMRGKQRVIVYEPSVWVLMHLCSAERLGSLCRCSLSLAQLLYARSPRLEYHLLGPDQSLRAIRAGEKSKLAGRPGERKQGSTHPVIIYPSKRISSFDRPTHRLLSRQLPPPPPDCSRVREGGAGQDARWDRRADTRSSAVANLRPLRCKSVL